MHRYVAFINFQADVHNMILELKKDLEKKVHHAGFMVTDEDVDALINLWLEKWCSPLVEPLPEGNNAEEPPLHQVNDEENEGDENKDYMSQERNEDDDNIDKSEHHVSNHPPIQDHAQKQTHA